MVKTEEPIGCLAAILRLFGIGLGRPTTPTDLPYRRRDDFLSPAEFSFYRVLASGSSSTDAEIVRSAGRLLGG